MTRRPPISRRTIGQLALVAVLTVAVIAGLPHLRATFPHRDVDPLLEGVEGIRGEDVEQVTCRRTLPDRPARPLGGDVPSPVGLVRSTQVVACPGVFDPDSDGGPPVEYVGEVVGDVLQREGGAWVLMNDDNYALESGPLPSHGDHHGTNSGLTVWLPTDAIDAATLTPGRPDLRGDVLVVSGRIHRTDPADGGGLTLRAFEATVAAPAQEVPQPLHGRQAAVAVLLALAAVGIALHVRASSRPWRP